MDNIENLTRWILTQADAEAQRILLQSKEKRLALLAKEEQRCERQFSERNEQLRSFSREKIQRAREQEHSILQKDRLTYKQSLIDASFVRAEERLCALSGPEFLSLFSQTVAALPLEGKYLLRLGERTARMLSQKERAELSVETAAYTISLSEEILPAEGGFVLERYPIELSFLYRDLLADRKAKESTKLMNLLLDEHCPPRGMGGGGRD